MIYVVSARLCLQRRSGLTSARVLPFRQETATAPIALLRPLFDSGRQRVIHGCLRPACRADLSEVSLHFIGRRGDAERGSTHFETLCAQCHRHRGVGYPVGPDLGMAFTKGEEDLLTSILDPSAVLAPEYANYLIETTDGELLNGIISAETAGSVTLARANGEIDIVLRSQIQDIRTEGRSLMPDGLEQGLDAGGLADLLAHLRQHSH